MLKSYCVIENRRRLTHILKSYIFWRLHAFVNLWGRGHPHSPILFHYHAVFSGKLDKQYNGKF